MKFSNVHIFLDVYMINKENVVRSLKVLYWYIENNDNSIT